MYFFSDKLCTPVIVSFFISIYLFYIVTIFFAYNVSNKKITKIETLALTSSITITKADWPRTVSLAVQTQRTGSRAVTGSEPALKMLWWKRGYECSKGTIKIKCSRKKKKERNHNPLVCHFFTLLTSMLRL